MTNSISLFYYIYQVAGVLNRKIVHIFHHLITLLKFMALCKEFHSFKTFGIPFVEISRKYGGSIIIGNSFWINNGMSNNQIGYGKSPCVLKATNGKIIIGDNVGISQTALIAHNADILIGDNTKIGGGVKIYTTDFHSLYFSDRKNLFLDKKNTKCSPVSIGSDCFIGAGTIILKGVSIGDRSIIGAGSIVTKSIPSDCIAAGNPCRIIKEKQETHGE